MSKGDLLVERGAKRLEELSRKAAAKGGFAARLSDELAEDAVFLRKLKPSLIKARAKGKAPTNQAPPREPQAPTEPEAPTEPHAPSAPQIARPRRRPKAKAQKRKRTQGPNPFLVAGVALVAGIALAKMIDWRGHAHPRD
jgi:hypothetical protein